MADRKNGGLSRRDLLLMGLSAAEATSAIACGISDKTPLQWDQPTATPRPRATATSTAINRTPTPRILIEALVPEQQIPAVVRPVALKAREMRANPLTRSAFSDTGNLEIDLVQMEVDDQITAVFLPAELFGVVDIGSKVDRDNRTIAGPNVRIVLNEHYISDNLKVELRLLGLLQLIDQKRAHEANLRLFLGHPSNQQTRDMMNASVELIKFNSAPSVLFSGCQRLEAFKRLDSNFTAPTPMFDYEQTLLGRNETLYSVYLRIKDMPNAARSPQWQQAVRQLPN